MNTSRPSLHRAHSSITYHPPTTHKPALPVLNEAPGGRSGASGLKKWFVLVEYGPELDSDHAGGGTVLSFLQPTAHQQLVHTIPQLHLPSPIGLSLLLRLSTSMAGLEQSHAKIDDLIWPHLFAQYFLPSTEVSIRGLELYGQLPIVAHVLLRVDTRRAKWYESWRNDPTIGSLERWVDLERYRTPDNGSSPTSSPARGRPRAFTAIDVRPQRQTPALPATASAAQPDEESIVQDQIIEPSQPNRSVIAPALSPINPSPIDTNSPQPNPLPSPLESRNRRSLTIAVPSPAAWSNATSWGPPTTFSPYPPIEWMGSPGHVWTPDVGERAAGSVPTTPCPNPPTRDAQSSASEERQGLWDGVWPFFVPSLDHQNLGRGDITGGASSTTHSPPSAKVAAFSHSPSQDGLWPGVWPFPKTAQTTQTTVDTGAARREVQQPVDIPKAVVKAERSPAAKLNRATAPPVPRKRDVRSTVTVTRPAVPRGQSVHINNEERHQTSVQTWVHEVETNHDSLFEGTIFETDSTREIPVHRNMFSPRSSDRTKSPARDPSSSLEFIPHRRPPPLPQDQMKLSQRISGLPQGVRPESHAVSQTPDQDRPISAWRAPWDPSEEESVPPLPEKSTRSQTNHHSSSSSSSLYQTPAPSSTTVSTIPTPSTPKRPFKRLSRSLSSSVSSFSEGGVDLSMPLNSPRRPERTKRDSPLSSPTDSEGFELDDESPARVLAVSIGVAVRYPDFDLYPGANISKPIDLGVVVDYPRFFLHPASTPMPLNIGVRVIYPKFDLYPAESPAAVVGGAKATSSRLSHPAAPPLGQVDIGARVIYPHFELYPSLAPVRPVDIGVAITYPLLNVYSITHPQPIGIVPTIIYPSIEIYPPAGRVTKTVDIGVVIQYPEMIIYHPSLVSSTPKNISILLQRIVYPRLEIYPTFTDPSVVRPATIPIALCQCRYPNLIIYPPPECSSQPKPSPRPILLDAFNYPNILLYPQRQTSESVKGIKIMLCAHEYPNIVLYPNADRPSTPLPASILLVPFAYPHIILYPPLRLSQRPPVPVQVSLCQLLYPAMTIYPIVTHPTTSGKPVLHKIDTSPVTPRRPPRRSARSQTVSTVNSVDFLKTPESTTSSSTPSTIPRPVSRVASTSRSDKKGPHPRHAASSAAQQTRDQSLRRAIRSPSDPDSSACSEK